MANRCHADSGEVTCWSRRLGRIAISGISGIEREERSRTRGGGMRPHLRMAWWLVATSALVGCGSEGSVAPPPPQDDAGAVAVDGAIGQGDPDGSGAGDGARGAATFSAPEIAFGAVGCG